ncbi:MAG: hypothetical protein HY342_05075 [Candidatus Lambdaproteobacteria bacterium]|nr:hypothetical protein [Candidatus Lambdaproteobacteria bacterium]
MTQHPDHTTCGPGGRSPRPLAGLALALLLAWVLPAAPRAAQAAQELSTDAQHQGLIAFGDFQIFPQNRRGNGVYANNRLIFNLPEETVVYVQPLPQPGRMVYLAKNEQGQARLGVVLGARDPEPRVTRLGARYFHAVMVVDGVVYKKVYFVTAEDTVVDLLPSSKTADGLTLGPGGLLFYHVAAANHEEQDGKPVSTFDLRVHLVPPDGEQARHLGYPILNSLPRLDMEWIDANRIRYRLSDGREGALSVSQFQ